jgi:hypothetical protein
MRGIYVMNAKHQRESRHGASARATDCAPARFGAELSVALTDWSDLVEHSDP